MAFTQADVDSLKRVIASGILRVRFEDGRERTYHSLSEMRDALKMIEGEVAATSGAPRPRFHTVAGF